jgi:hypothetical protein
VAAIAAAAVAAALPAVPAARVPVQAALAQVGRAAAAAVNPLAPSNPSCLPRRQPPGRQAGLPQALSSCLATIQIPPANTLIATTANTCKSQSKVMPFPLASKLPPRHRKACAKYRNRRWQSSFAHGKTPQSCAKTEDENRSLEDIGGRENDRNGNQTCSFICINAHLFRQALTKRQAREKNSPVLHKTSREKRKVHARILPFKGETKNA